VLSPESALPIRSSNEEAKAAEDIGCDGCRGSRISAKTKEQAREEAEKARRENCAGEAAIA
jgi:hypothetical protein